MAQYNVLDIKFSICISPGGELEVTSSALEINYLKHWQLYSKWPFVHKLSVETPSSVILRYVAYRMRHPYVASVCGIRMRHTVCPEFWGNDSLRKNRNQSANIKQKEHWKIFQGAQVNSMSDLSKILVRNPTHFCILSKYYLQVENLNFIYHKIVCERGYTYVGDWLWWRNVLVTKAKFFNQYLCSLWTFVKIQGIWYRLYHTAITLYIN